MSIEVQVRYSHDKNETAIRASVLRKMGSWQQSSELKPQILNLLLVANDLSLMVDNSNYMFNQKLQKLTDDEYLVEICRLCTYKIPYMEIEFIWSESLLYVYFDNKLYVQPRSVLLMYHNKICDLISVLLYSNYSSGNSLPIDAYQITCNFVSELCRILIKYKNDGFHILKVLEGLVIAETLPEIEEWENKEFMTNIVNDLRAKMKFDHEKSRIKSILMSCDIPLRHDLGCLSKIVGHPLVSMEGGSKTYQLIKSTRLCVFLQKRLY